MEEKDELRPEYDFSKLKRVPEDKIHRLRPVKDLPAPNPQIMTDEDREKRRQAWEGHVCGGCGRKALHKICPAWGTPYYMSGQLYTEELEAQYHDMHMKAREESAKMPYTDLD